MASIRNYSNEIIFTPYLLRKQKSLFTQPLWHVTITTQCADIASMALRERKRARDRARYLQFRNAELRRLCHQDPVVHTHELKRGRMSAVPLTNKSVLPSTYGFNSNFCTICLVLLNLCHRLWFKRNLLPVPLSETTVLENVQIIAKLLVVFLMPQMQYQYITL